MDFLLRQTAWKQHRDLKPGSLSHKWQLIKLDLKCGYNETIIFQSNISLLSKKAEDILWHVLLFMPPVFIFSCKCT